MPAPISGMPSSSVIALQPGCCSEQALKWAADLLAHSSDIPNLTPRLDADLLLCCILGCSRASLWANAERQLTTEQLQQFQQFIAERQTGCPLAYLTGEQEFYGLLLQVNRHTLIPRPDTETVVELVLRHFNDEIAFSCLDLGCGSGAIGLAIAANRPLAKVQGVDISESALLLAKHNAERLGISNIQWLLSDWCKNVTGRFDVVLSNPPYLAADDPHLSGAIQFEPRTALVAVEQGLGDIRKIADAALSVLQPDGLFLVEHGCEQGSEVREILQRTGYHKVQTLYDLSGQERVTQAFPS